MTGDRNAELREALAKATPRPWIASISWGHPDSVNGPAESSYCEGVLGETYFDNQDVSHADWIFRFDDDYGTPQMENAALIVATVNNLEALLDENEALKAEISRLVVAADALERVAAQGVAQALGWNRLAATSTEYRVAKRAALARLEGK